MFVLYRKVWGREPRLGKSCGGPHGEELWRFSEGSLSLCLAVHGVIATRTGGAPNLEVGTQNCIAK